MCASLTVTCTTTACHDHSSLLRTEDPCSQEATSHRASSIQAQWCCGSVPQSSCFWLLPNIFATFCGSRACSCKYSNLTFSPQPELGAQGVRVRMTKVSAALLMLWLVVMMRILRSSRCFDGFVLLFFDPSFSAWSESFANHNLTQNERGMTSLPTGGATSPRAKIKAQRILTFLFFSSSEQPH